MYLFRNAGVVQHAHDELAAAIGFVTRREAAAQHEDVAGGYPAAHLVDGLHHIGTGEVAEYTRRDLRTRPAERLGRIVIAVRPGKRGQISNRMLLRGPRILEPNGTGHTLHDGRFGRSPVGIDRGELHRIGLQQAVDRHPLSIDRHRLCRHGPA